MTYPWCDLPEAQSWNPAGNLQHLCRQPRLQKAQDRTAAVTQFKLLLQIRVAASATQRWASSTALISAFRSGAWCQELPCACTGTVLARNVPRAELVGQRTPWSSHQLPAQPQRARWLGSQHWEQLRLPGARRQLCKAKLHRAHL